MIKITLNPCRAKINKIKECDNMLILYDFDMID